MHEGSMRGGCAVDPDTADERTELGSFGEPVKNTAERLRVLLRDDLILVEVVHPSVAILVQKNVGRASPLVQAVFRIIQLLVVIRRSIAAHDENVIGVPSLRLEMGSDRFK